MALYMQLPVIENGKWTGAWHSPVPENVAPTLASLRAVSRYWVVSDAQLKRDLQPRTLKDIYRENRALRAPERRYTPRHDVIVAKPVHNGYGRNRQWEYEDVLTSAGGLGVSPASATVRDEYLAWCKARKHKPHPASLDPNHPINQHREKCPRRETVSA